MDGQTLSIPMSPPDFLGGDNKHMFRRCINETETAYYVKSFQDIKSTSYNTWKHLRVMMNHI